MTNFVRSVCLNAAARTRRALSAARERSVHLVADLHAWMREHRAGLSGKNDVAKAMDYMLKRWAAFVRFLEDGRICLTNNAAERALRGIALGRNHADHAIMRTSLAQASPTC